MRQTDIQSTVLVSTDEGMTWRRFQGIPGVPEQAIRRVREQHEQFRDPDTLFYATTRFRIRKWEKQLVERLSMQSVELGEPAPSADGLDEDETPPEL